MTEDKIKQLRNPPAKPYELTPYERAAVDAYVAHKQENPPPPRLKVSGTEDSKVLIGPDHPHYPTGMVLLYEALGTKDEALVSGLLGQLATVAKGDEREMNFMLSMVQGLKPKDPLEVMLATQMAAVQALIMRHAIQLANSDTYKGQEHAERTLNKLARTFLSQVETLKRYRTGGEQKVTVQHVSVNDNAQAIVGNVSTGGGGDKKK
jgi:hypothetical protein